MSEDVIFPAEAALCSVTLAEATLLSATLAEATLLSATLAEAALRARTPAVEALVEASRLLALEREEQLARPLRLFHAQMLDVHLREERWL